MLLVVGPHDGVEVGFPSEWEDLLLPCTDNNSDRTPAICGAVPSLYVNVSPHVVRVVIQKHGGQRQDSDRLPPMVEFDEDGYLWAAAAEPPSYLDEESEPEGYGSPASTVHLGAPPPLPPPLPQQHGTPTPGAGAATAAGQRVGELTPPLTLTDAGLSPIER